MARPLFRHAPLKINKLFRSAVAILAALGMLLAALWPVTSAQARPLFFTLDLQPDGSSGIDTTIFSDFPTHNYGAATSLDVGSYVDNLDIRRGLIKFDLSGIPAGSVINWATLRLYMTNNLAGNTRTLRVYRMTQPWVEGAENDTVCSGDASWNQFDCSSGWPGGAGAFGAGNSETFDIGGVSISSGAGAGVQAMSLDPGYIQDMISGGGFTNNGFLLKNDTENNDDHRFASSDDSTAGHRPELIIDYTLPTDTPTPTPSSATETPTTTPTPTATATLTPTPGYDTVVILPSGDELLIERRWDFGQLAILLAIVAFTALYGLRWIYEVVRREVR